MENEFAKLANVSVERLCCDCIKTVLCQYRDCVVFVERLCCVDIETVLCL